MPSLRRMLDKMEPLFQPGGRYEKFAAVFEMVDTLFYSPSDTTRGSPHARDAIDLKRVMILVVFAATPAALIGMWNTGFQANTALAAIGVEGQRRLAPAGQAFDTDRGERRRWHWSVPVTIRPASTTTSCSACRTSCRCTS